MTTAVRTLDKLFDAPVPAPLDGPLAALRAAPEEIHPALALAWRIRQREQACGGTIPVDELIALAPELEAAIAAADHTLTQDSAILRTLKAFSQPT